MKRADKLFKFLKPKSKTAKYIMQITAIIVVSFLGILWYQHHRPTYSATGIINVFPQNSAAKNYRLKVGEPNADDIRTFTILVNSVTGPWYSPFQHYEYVISDASWPDNSVLSFQNVYCSITRAKNSKSNYCVADDGKGYYIEIESLGPNILDQYKIDTNPMTSL